MILVTGATGHLGAATIGFLLQSKSPAGIAALVRDPAKATDLAAKGITLRTGDYDDYASLVKAFEGVSTLLLISSSTLEDRVTQHTNAIRAAKENGVQHIIYTSILKAAPDLKFIPGIDHFHTEEYLKQAAIPYTVFRNTFYAEFLAQLLGEALKSGEWYYPAGNATINFAARPDMAEALSKVLTDPQPHRNKIYEIAAGRSYSFGEIAGIVSRITGTPLTYQDIPVAALKGGLTQGGLPPALVDMLVSGAEAIRAGELDITDDSLEKLLHRKPVTLEEYLPELLGRN